MSSLPWRQGADYPTPIHRGGDPGFPAKSKIWQGGSGRGIESNVPKLAYFPLPAEIASALRASQ